MAPTEYTYDEEARVVMSHMKKELMMRILKIQKNYPNQIFHRNENFIIIFLYTINRNQMEWIKVLVNGMARISPTRETIGDNNIHFQDIYYEKKHPRNIIIYLKLY